MQIKLERVELQIAMGVVMKKVKEIKSEGESEVRKRATLNHFTRRSTSGSKKYERRKADLRVGSCLSNISLFRNAICIYVFPPVAMLVNGSGALLIYCPLPTPGEKTKLLFLARRTEKSTSHHANKSHYNRWN
jgi:hypothetical protein